MCGRYADYHLLSCLTRCCLQRQRKRWSRISASEVSHRSTEIQILDGTADYATSAGNLMSLQAHDAETSHTWAGKHPPSAPLQVCAWVTWATAALAVTAFGTAIWVMTAKAAGVNLHHAEAMAAG